MERVDQRIKVITCALKKLSEAMMMFELVSKDEKLFGIVRAGMIKRFEDCTDLFWKVLKIYLEEVGGIALKAISPKGIIRDAVQAKVITEKEGSECMEMIESRNRTSHIYHEDLAEEIAAEVPGFYRLMHTVVKRLEQNLD